MQLRLNPTLAELFIHVNALKMQDLVFTVGFNFTCRIYFYTQRARLFSEKPKKKPRKTPDFVRNLSGSFLLFKKYYRLPAPRSVEVPDNGLGNFLSHFFLIVLVELHVVIVIDETGLQKRIVHAHLLIDSCVQQAAGSVDA